MRITLIALFSLGILIAVMASLAARRSKQAQPDYFHWIVRLLCAVLCVAALMAVGVGTWRGTKDDMSSPQVTVMTPTLPPPPLAPTENYDKINIGPCKLIGTVLVALKQQSRFLPLCGESLIIDWPAEANTQRVFQGECRGTSYTIRLNLQEFFCTGKDGQILIQNGLSFVVRVLNFSSSSSGGTFILDTPKTMNFGNGFEATYHAPLSVIPVGGDSDLQVLFHLTRADRDDPLAEIPAARWLTDNSQKPLQDTSPHNSYPGVRFDPNAPPGLRMLVFLGPSAFLLLIAAIAGAVCARRGRRSYSFAALLALTVLYAGGLDALVLQRRVGLTIDASQPESVRAMALGRMLHGTFFHTGAARTRIGEIAADPASPESLQQEARSMVHE